MSIASRITAITGHITDIYDTMALGGDTTQNKNIVNINTEIKREYKDFLANGTDTLWNNWEKVSGSGETLSLTPTIKAKMKVDLKGNTQQNGTPTPSTPIPVQVVSGDNTIKVANGDNTEYEEYPISLGNIELCKIGTYQDYIYKDSGKWYLHKEIGKVVLNGSENWQVSNTGLNNYILYCLQSAGIDGNVGYSNYYPVVAISGSNTNQGICTAGGYVRVRYGEEPTIPDFKTSLSTHNVSLYNPLATPTYEEITDTTLLSQLEALAYSYDGTTNISQVNDDMPFVLDITALKEMS